MRERTSGSAACVGTDRIMEEKGENYELFLGCDAV
jgi:hypothetical protein